MTAAVFTYGSLMFDEVWRRVVRGRYESSRATVRGYQRYCVADETYPGMIACAGQSVEGVVYFGVDHVDRAALDAFEGDDYVRLEADVVLQGGETVRADTYLYLPYERLTGEIWRPEAFEMKRFLDIYCAHRGV